MGTKQAAAAEAQVPRPRLPHPSAPATLVLGLGNDLLTDDGIGLHIARALARECPCAGSVTILESQEMGLALLDHIVGFDDLVLIDSIQTGSAPVGFLHEFRGEDTLTRRGGSPHFLGVGDTLALGRLLGLPMPERVRIFAVEVADPYTLGCQLSPALQGAAPGIIKRIKAALGWAVPTG